MSSWIIALTHLGYILSRIKMVHKARDKSSYQAYSCYSGVVYIDVSAAGLEKL